MSSNQNLDQNQNASGERQMSSIANGIHRSWIWKSFGRCLRTDFLLGILLFGFTLLVQEMTVIGRIVPGYHRELLFLAGEPEAASLIGKAIFYIERLCYVVRDADMNVLLELPMGPMIRLILMIVAAAAGCQILHFLGSYRADGERIRKHLQPINQIALKADQLSRMTFSEDKYQQIENAITQLKPEESELLSFGDSDLQGIEAAMNNLLIHMREANQQQARFVNDASHELRTPIAVIQGYANMLSRWGSEDPKVLDESITAISHEADHMKYLVEQLLFLARGDSGRMVLKKEEVCLNDLMQEIYEESFMIDEEHPYRFKPVEEQITVTADLALLKQAARILIDNAAKYTKTGDEIYLSYGRTEEGNAYMQIQDTGIGMAENDVAHMFERFYRSDEVRSYQGTGLGLSIAKWIVDKHRGHFEILSRTELGTRIRIIFE